jgi:1-phosphofructokinase family hexose kinase
MIVSRPFVLCITLNPVLDTTYFVDEMRPTYRTEAHRVTHIAGGKGNNVARALGLLGAPAVSLVALGGMVGRMVAEVWQADPFEGAPVWVSGETRLQITVIDRHGTQRAFYAPAAPFAAEDAERAEENFAKLLPGANAVCLCGSSPGAAADPLYERFIRLARERGALTLLDTYGASLAAGLRARPDVVKVNAAEAGGLLGREVKDAAQQRAAVEALRAAGAGIAVMTLGEQGALLAGDEGVRRASPPPVNAINPIGSGDAMTAGIVAGLLRGEGAAEAFRRGMAAAAANTLTWDACRVDAGEAERLLALVDAQPLP